jgi:hypothetical protein
MNEERREKITLFLPGVGQISSFFFSLFFGLSLFVFLGA